MLTVYSTIQTGRLRPAHATIPAANNATKTIAITATLPAGLEAGTVTIAVAVAVGVSVKTTGVGLGVEVDGTSVGVSVGGTGVGVSAHPVALRHWRPLRRLQRKQQGPMRPLQ